MSRRSKGELQWLANLVDEVWTGICHVVVTIAFAIGAAMRWVTELPLRLSSRQDHHRDSTAYGEARKSPTNGRTR